MDIAPAETVVPGQVVIVLGDLSNYQIETTDSERTRCDRVQIGQPANVFIEALNENFTGQVMDIDRAHPRWRRCRLQSDHRLDTQPEGLLWGMSADVQIETAE